MGYTNKIFEAAKIIRYTYKGRKASDRKAFENMVMNIWYPVIKDWTPKYNSNWYTANIQTMMCIGIVMDRHAIFDSACQYVIGGNTNGSVKNYFYDNGHSVFNNRMHRAFEYTAKYMLGHEVPFKQYVSWFGKKMYGTKISPSQRDKVFPVWERVYHHYHDRMGIEMPYTRQMIERSRPDEGLVNQSFMPWATPASANYPVNK